MFTNISRFFSYGSWLFTYDCLLFPNDSCLFTISGKPIPSVDPVIVSASKNNEDNSAKKTVQQPKINIVSMASKVANDKNPNKATNGQGEVTIPLLPDEKVVQPVGLDYIEEVKNDEGKVISFR